MRQCWEDRPGAYATSSPLPSTKVQAGSVLTFTLFILTLKQAPRMHQVAQLSQTDHAAGWNSYGQKWKSGTRRQHFTDIIGLSSTTVT